MKKFFIILSLTVISFTLLTGCKKNDGVRIEGITVKEINIEKLNSKLAGYVSKASHMNGVLLFQENDKVFYIFLNGFNAVEEDKLPFFEDIKIEVEEDEIIFSYNEKYTDNYISTTTNGALFKITKHQDYEVVRVLKNGKVSKWEKMWIYGW